MKLAVILSILVPVLATSARANKVLRSTFSVQNRIAGGDPAELGQFPFQVGVQSHYRTKDNEEYTGWCGGSLISEQIVLTAAHCVHRGFMTEIFLGAVDLARQPVIYAVDKENITIHKGYGSKFGIDDVALVMLPHKIDLNERIQIVNLPRRSQKDMSFVKSIGWISGWGRMGDKVGSTEKLQYARRWILPDEHCIYYYSAWYDKPTQICVDGSHGISACKGDSGGPLTIVEDDGTRTLVGLASYERTEGCEKNFPVVYQRITGYLDWISENSGITIRE